MCKLYHFKDPSCNHHWARIAHPCAHGTGFSDCPSFTDLNYVKGTPRAFIATREPCPTCDLKGCYDRNQIRMVTRQRKGFKIGKGPAKADRGVELFCCSVM